MVFHFVLEDQVHTFAPFVRVVNRARAKAIRSVSDAASSDARSERRRCRSDKVVPDVVTRGMIDRPLQQHGTPFDVQ